MTNTSVPDEAFAHHTTLHDRAALDDASRSMTERLADTDRGEVLVIVARPTRDDHRVFGGGGNGSIRAAVSVAVAAQNHRIWNTVVPGDITDRPVHTLPEIVRAAADACGMRTVRVGVSEGSDRAASVALWFTPSNIADGGDPNSEERQDLLAFLSEAGAHDIASAEQRAVSDRRAAATLAAATPSLTTTLLDDAETDSLTGLANRRRLERELAECEAGEASVLLVGLDELDQIEQQYGQAIRARVVAETAARLASVCRRHDLIARIDGDEFVLLLVEVDRATALSISKRVLDSITAPLPPELGPLRIDANIGLAHQVGMLDTEEMLELATEAMNSGRRVGAGRVVIAA